MEAPTATGTENIAAATRSKAPVSSRDQFYFIKLNPDLGPRAWQPFFGSRAHAIWLLAPLLLIPLFVVLRKKQEERQRDVEGIKIKRANRLARKFLSRARKVLGDKDAFYVALEKALHNYLKAKLKIETSEFSKEKISELMQQRKVPEAAQAGFIELLVNCEMARYRPFSRVQMQQDYDKASDVITTLDKYL